jgi:hypothetical protein
MTDAAGDKTQYFYDTGTLTGPVTSGGVTVTCDQCGATPGLSFAYIPNNWTTNMAYNNPAIFASSATPTIMRDRQFANASTWWCGRV